MILAGASVFIDTSNYINGVDEQIQLNTSQLKTIQETTSKQQIETTKKIYNLLDSLADQTSNYRRETNKHLENIYKSLKTKPK